MRRTGVWVRVLLAVVLALGGACAVVPGVALAEEGSGYSADEPPALSSPHALLVDAETDTVLLDQGADERCYPASTTKVMTALLVLERCDLDDEVTVEESDLAEVPWYSSTAELVAGETLSVRDLLAGLLVPSGNDASYVLARHVAGDWQSFVDLMNERAQELGCEGTHFVNPCGLHDDDHYTTARDLVTIFEAALEHPEFSEITSCLTWELPATSAAPARTLEATDDLIDPESPVYMSGDVVAGKTGYTGEAGRCLVVAAQRDGRSLLCAVLGASADEDAAGVTANFYDTQALLEWGFGAWETGEVVSPGDVLGSVEVTLSSDGDEVSMASGGAVYATVPAGTSLEDLTVETSWSGSLQAPLDAGQELGQATVSLDGRVLGTVSAVAASAMALSIPSFVMWWLSDPLHAVIAVAVAVAVFVVIGLVGSARSQRRRRARQRMAVAGPRAGSYSQRGGVYGQRYATPPTDGSGMRRVRATGGRHAGGRHAAGSHASTRTRRR